MSRLIRTAGIGFVLLLCVRAADASDHLRCGNRFVRHGDTKYEVLRHCGEPVYKDRISGDDADAIEQWVYELSWTRFPRMVTFVSGRVARIERLDD
jgi:hypothetical protein